VGCSRELIDTYERGEVRPQEARLQRIAALLDVGPEPLFRQAGYLPPLRLKIS
jgi:transcriptional regulator with XRE-family HTH domain